MLNNKCVRAQNPARRARARAAHFEIFGSRREARLHHKISSHLYLTMISPLSLDPCRSEQAQKQRLPIDSQWYSRIMTSMGIECPEKTSSFVQRIHHHHQHHASASSSHRRRQRLSHHSVLLPLFATLLSLLVVSSVAFTPLHQSQTHNQAPHGRQLQASSGACISHEQEMATCLETRLNAALLNECDRCIATSLPTTPQSCSVIDDSFCNELAVCPCGPCRQVIKDYVGCALEDVTGCLMDCRKYDVKIEQAPVRPPCWEEQDVLSSCLVNSVGTFGETVCNNCVSSRFPANGWSASCKEWETSICFSQETCPCMSCQEELENLYKCLLPTITSAGCTLDCDNFISPTQSPTNRPTKKPTLPPTLGPTVSLSPTSGPTITAQPSETPVTSSPTEEPLTKRPTQKPTAGPVSTTSAPVGSSPTTAKPAVGTLVPSLPPVPATPSPSGTPQGLCPHLLHSVQLCYEKDFAGVNKSACNACVGAAFLTSQDASCHGTYRDTLCEALQVTCASVCGMCAIYQEFYIECLLNSGDEVCHLNCANDPSITQAPSIAPQVDSPVATPVASPPALQCVQEFFNYQTCMASDLSEERTQFCNECIAGSLPPFYGSTCDDFRNGLCPAMSTICRDICGSCSEYIETYFDCFLPANGVECALDCENYVQPPAEESSFPCPNELFNIQFCYEASGIPRDNRVACNECVANSLPEEAETCSDYTTSLCQNLENSCADTCGNCVHSIQNYMQCLLTENDVNCPLDCFGDEEEPVDGPSLAPATPSPTSIAVDNPELKCLDEFYVFQTCTITGISVSGGSTCSNCVQSFLPTLPLSTCEEYQSNICTSLSETCANACQSCVDSIESYANCLLKANGLDCTLGCGESPPDLTTVSPTITPQVCDVSQSTMEECVASLPSTAASKCMGCKNRAVILQKVGPDADCNSVSSVVCPILSQGDCFCGKCQESVESYLSCELSQNSQQCSLSCEPPVVVPGKTSSAFATRSILLSVTLGLATYALLLW